MEGSEIGGVVVARLGIDVVVGLGVEVEVAGVAEVDEASGRITGCSAGILSEVVEGG